MYEKPPGRPGKAALGLCVLRDSLPFPVLSKASRATKKDVTATTCGNDRWQSATEAILTPELRPLCTRSTTALPLPLGA